MVQQGSGMICELWSAVMICGIIGRKILSSLSAWAHRILLQMSRLAASRNVTQARQKSPAALNVFRLWLGLQKQPWICEEIIEHDEDLRMSTHTPKLSLGRSCPKRLKIAAFGSRILPSDAWIDASRCWQWVVNELKSQTHGILDAEARKTWLALEFVFMITPLGVSNSRQA